LLSVVAVSSHSRVGSARAVVPLTPPAATKTLAAPPETNPTPPDPRLTPAVLATTPSVRAADKVPVHADPGPTTEVSTKTPEFPKITRIVTPVRDTETGEADRVVTDGTATVIARGKDLPLLRDDQAFETWGGEFAQGDSRLKDMIQAGALTSVQKGAKVRILEVRGALAHVEVVGQGRTGWIRSAYLGR
jgi:hypothetical protein